MILYIHNCPLWPETDYLTKVKATQRNKQHVKGWKSGDLSFENQKIPSNSDLNTKQKDDPNSIIVFSKSFLDFNIICWLSILEIYRFQNPSAERERIILILPLYLQKSSQYHHFVFNYIYKIYGFSDL